MKAVGYLNLYTREQLADRCARLDGELAAEHARAEALKHSLGLAEDENAKLRELLTIASDMAHDYDGDRRLLRRLVQELYEDQCDECDQWKYRDRMRELEVEVD